ncbi:synaptonemal complex protein 2-like isoform X2 [Pomacea canaliculata]|nr:synaptonemal complex protein 2-like isoform X2 [Pomacea canaliculata]
MPIHLENQILDLLLENIICVNERGVKSNNFALPYITGPCLDFLLNGAVPFLSKMEVLKTLNIVYESSTHAVKQDILYKEETKFKVERLFQLIIDIGDYEFQVGVIEFLFRLIPRKSRQTYLQNVIKQAGIFQACFNIRDNCFEIDCRRFLNHLNSSLFAKRKVFSYPCQAIAIGSFELQKPSDDGYNDFWIDFNQGSHRMTVFCENAPTSTQTSAGESFWDTVSVWHKDLISFRCWEEGKMVKACILLRSSADCFIASEIDHNVYVTMDRQYNLENALVQTFTRKKKTSDSVNSLHILTSQSCLEKPENHSVGVETAAGPEEPLEKEVKRVLSVYASSHKVSIPTDPMSTPASTISFVSLSSNKSGIFAKKSPEFGKDIHKSSCLPQEKKAKAKQKVLKKQPQKWDKTNTHIVTCQTVKKKEDSGKTSLQSKTESTPQGRVTRSSQKLKNPVAIFKEPSARQQGTRKTLMKSKSFVGDLEIIQTDAEIQLAGKEDSLSSIVIPDSLPMPSQLEQEPKENSDRKIRPENKECEAVLKGGECMQRAETFKMPASNQITTTQQDGKKDKITENVYIKQMGPLCDSARQTSITNQQPQLCTPLVQPKKCTSEIAPSSLDEFKDTSCKKFRSKSCLNKSYCSSMSKKSSHKEVSESKNLAFDTLSPVDDQCILPECGKKQKHMNQEISEELANTILSKDTQEPKSSEKQAFLPFVSRNNNFDTREIQTKSYSKYHEDKPIGKQEVTIGTNQCLGVCMSKSTKMTKKSEILVNQTENLYKYNDDDEDNTDFRFDNCQDLSLQTNDDFQIKDFKPCKKQGTDRRSKSDKDTGSLKMFSREKVNENVHNLRKQQRKSYKEYDKFSEDEEPGVSKISQNNKLFQNLKILTSFKDTKFVFTSAEERLTGSKKKCVKMFAMTSSQRKRESGEKTVNHDQDPYDFREDEAEISSVLGHKSSINKGKNHSELANFCTFDSVKLSRRLSCSTEENKLKRKLTKNHNTPICAGLFINEKSPSSLGASSIDSSPKLFFSQPKKPKLTSGLQRKNKSEKKTAGMESSKSKRTKRLPEKCSKKRNSASIRKSKISKEAAPTKLSFGDDICVSNRSELSWIAKHSSKFKGDTRLSKTYKRKIMANSVSPQPQHDLACNRISTQAKVLQSSPLHQTVLKKGRSKPHDSPLNVTIKKSPITVASFPTSEITKTKKGTQKAISISENSSSQNSQENSSFYLSQLCSVGSQQTQNDGNSPACSSYDVNETGKRLQAWKKKTLLISPKTRDINTSAKSEKHCKTQTAKHMECTENGDYDNSNGSDEAENLSAIDKGCISGPSSRIRPSKSQEQCDSSDSEQCMSDESSEMHLLPRRLFTEDNAISVTGKKNLGSAQMSYAGDGEQTTTDKQQMASTEASLSQMDLCPEEEDGENPEFSLKKVSAVLQGFSNDLQTQIKERELQIQDLSQNAWRLSSKYVHHMCLEEKDRREKIVKVFQEKVSSELSSLERDISALKEAEAKTLDIYLQQLKVLRDYREKAPSRVKAMKIQHADFWKETVELTQYSYQTQQSMQSQLRKNMKMLEKKFLLQMQHQQLQNLKKSLQKLF